MEGREERKESKTRFQSFKFQRFKSASVVCEHRRDMGWVVNPRLVRDASNFGDTSVRTTPGFSRCTRRVRLS